MSLFKNKITKVIFFSLNIFLLFDIFPIFSKSTKILNNSILSSKDKQIQNITNQDLENIIIKDEIRLDHLIYYLIANNIISKNDNEFYLDIESDKQYRENNIYYAEGNVIIKLKNGIIKADKFLYDKNNSNVELSGNISFNKGEQYFQASLIRYNFYSEEGFVNNIFGALNFNNLEEDLNLYQLDKKACTDEELSLLNLPNELELLNSKNARLDNIFGTNLDFRKISYWKFNSKKITIKKNIWQSEYIKFTNDPYENPQFFVESRNFKAEILDNNYKFTSKSTHLNFEDKLRIPIGNRTISDGNVGLKWGVGYDINKRDGLFFYRSSDNYQLTQNLNFTYKPYFLMQRAVIGKTKSFRLEDASFLDKKVEQNAILSDYFAMDADIKGKILNFDSNIKFDLNSFNESRLNDSLSIDANFLKTLYSSSNKTSNNKCSIQNDLPSKNFSIKAGFFGVYLKDNIYSGYGTKLLTNFSQKGKNIFDDYSLVLDLGSYKSKSLNNFRMLSLERYGINASFKRNYKLFDLNNKNTIYDNTFDKSPVVIDKALFLNIKLTTSIFQYSNKTSQRVFLAGIGPSFTIGNLKNNFLDYSSISIMPEFINKRGDSPFGFDNLNSDSRIKFVYQQQLYGPILIGLSSDLNISNKSKDYGKFNNIQYTLDISRRAYKISLFFRNKKSFGLRFNIFNF